LPVSKVFETLDSQYTAKPTSVATCIKQKLVLYDLNFNFPYQKLKKGTHY
jgi:hypothetical protein